MKRKKRNKEEEKKKLRRKESVFFFYLNSGFISELFLWKERTTIDRSSLFSSFWHSVKHEDYFQREREKERDRERENII